MGTLCNCSRHDGRPHNLWPQHLPSISLVQALAAHAINLWDKSRMFHAAAAFTGAGAGQHLLSALQVKGACRLSLPVLRENLNKVLRGTGGVGARLGSVVHMTSAEDAPDSDSEAVSRPASRDLSSIIHTWSAAQYCSSFRQAAECATCSTLPNPTPLSTVSSTSIDACVLGLQAASMVPEYLTPTNGGLLSPGQLMALARAVFGRYGGVGVAELVLEVTPDVMVGKVRHVFSALSCCRCV